MRSRKRIAIALDWLIAGWTEGPMIDQATLDAHITALADLEPRVEGAGDRATKVRADSPPTPDVSRLIASACRSPAAPGRQPTPDAVAPKRAPAPPRTDRTPPSG